MMSIGIPKGAGKIQSFVPSEFFDDRASLFNRMRLGFMIIPDFKRRDDWF
jgi:hypothetical protein